MKRIRMGVAVFGLLGLGVLAAGSQPPGDEKDKGPKGQPGQPGGPRGPGPFELGRLFPPFMRERLSLTAEQQKTIDELEKDVKARLEKILTAEQKKQLEEFSRRGPGRPGDDKGRPPEGKDRPKGGTKDKDKIKSKDKGEPPPEPQASAGGIPWFSTWVGGLAEARRTGKPIMLVSAAPHCAGVSGIW